MEGDAHPVYRTGLLPIFVDRWVFLIAGLFQIVAIAGSVFGWSIMAQVLKSEGYFVGRCPGGQGPCPAQNIAVDSMFTVASVASIVSPTLNGYILDRYGPRLAIQCMLVVFLAGVGCAISGDYQRNTSLLYVAFGCFGAASSPLLIPLFGIAAIFPRYEGLVVAIMNGCFDAASMVYLIMGKLHDGAGMRLYTIFSYYGIPCGIAVLLAVFLWRPAAFKPVDQQARDAAAAKLTSEGGDGATAGMDDQDGAHQTLLLDAAQKQQTQSGTLQPAATAASSSSGGSMKLQPLMVELDDDHHHHDDHHGATLLLVPAATTSTDGGCGSPVTKHEADVAARKGHLLALPVLRQLLSIEWIVFVAFHSVQMTLYNMVLGAIDSRLTSMGQVNGQYTNIFGTIAPFGSLVQFAVGPVLDNWGLDVSISIQWALGMVMCVLQLVPSLPVQIGAFVAFAAFRAFIFSNAATYMARTFGYGTMGVTIGVANLVAGAIGTSQNGLLAWAYVGVDPNSTKGDFTKPNILLMVLQTVAAVAPLWLLVRWRGLRALSQAVTRCTCCRNGCGCRRPAQQR